MEAYTAKPSLHSSAYYHFVRLMHSCARLIKNHTRMEAFFKVAIHELAHTEGLPHCKILTCYMRDAEGGNTLDEEISFCDNRKTYLIKRNWKFK